MRKEAVNFEYKIYDHVDELNSGDARLLQQAREVTSKAYAPYSDFFVGSVALLKNGAIVSGTNQENASYPVGICAERVLLGVAAVLHTDVPIETLVVSYRNNKGTSDKPISPCGMCRQALCEYETRTGHPIRIILSGESGPVYVLDTVSQLLPFSFGSKDLLS